jgi:nicotinamidase-related amidase
VNKYTDPHIARSALITIDTQNDFTLDNAPAFIVGTKEVVSNMAQLLSSYRSKGLLIIHVVRLYRRDGSNVELCRRQLIEEGREMVAPGTDGAELVDELKLDKTVRLNAEDLFAGQFQQIGNNEYVMYKPRWGAFYGTALESFLKERHIDTVIFCGCNFPNCPRASVYEASERDLRIVLVKDAMSQLYPKGEEEMKNIGVNLLTTTEMTKILA